MTATWGRPEAFALAQLIRLERRGWDELTTIDILLTLTGRDLADVAYAAIRTAQDPTMLTPQALKFVDSPHWRPTVRDTTPDRAMPAWEDTARLREIAGCQYCDVHGRNTYGHLCAHTDPTELAAKAKARADLARANIRTTPNPEQRDTP